jgi:hypothetical protein
VEVEAFLSVDSVDIKKVTNQTILEEDEDDVQTSVDNTKFYEIL